ncbi:MAG: ATP-binding protein, partial [Ignavibacteria bacterium]|nr:ATP-binding protein [Ignavibacteria bacterium]
MKIFIVSSVFSVVPLLLYSLTIPYIHINTMLLIALISLILLFLILYPMVKPVDEIEKKSSRFTSGDYSVKIFPPKDPQLRKIADSLNSMAQQLEEKLDIIGEQSNLQKAVLESMKEGVIAIDYDERLIFINKTACDMLYIEGKYLEGRTLQEVVRVSEIQKFFKKIINEKESQETEIILRENDKYLQLSGTLLYDADNHELGALVVLNDITNIKYIDTLKKDLVANVSHELKTPITTIKGFIETLREGAINEPTNAVRFLDIISKHIERLNLIIDDLLTLSKLEQKSEEAVELKDEQIKPLLESVREDYEQIYSKKKITVDINCDEKLMARINRHLIEQAISNLLDNAIKYSDKKTRIEIGAYEENGQICIYVEDEGYGISEEHIPRLFERFYRIDKGRSRDEGGTGLGLAIVKHIVNVCGGKVDV